MLEHVMMYVCAGACVHTQSVGQSGLQSAVEIGVIGQRPKPPSLELQIFCC